MFGFRRISSRFTSSIAFAICFLTPALVFGAQPLSNNIKGSSPQASLILYVAPNGNDSHQGILIDPTSKQGALATLDGARRAVRAYRAAGGTGPVIVYFRGGVYPLSAPVAFSAEDSGSPAAPVTYAAYPGEKPVFSGAIQLKRWNDAGGGRWTTVVSGKIDIRQLFFGDTRRSRSRLPRTGSFYVAGTEATLSTPIYLGGSEHFRFTPGQFKSTWHNLGDVEVQLRHFWTTAHLPIASIDDSASTVKFTRTTMYRLTDGTYLAPAGPRFIIENVFEALQPGDFYFDRITGVLTYFANPGENPNQVPIYVPVLNRLVVIDGGTQRVHDLVFDGLTFSHNQYSLPAKFGGDDWGAMDIPGAFVIRAASEITIRNSRFVHLGSYAIELKMYSTAISIVHNELSDLGAGGVKIWEEQDVDAIAGVNTSFGHSVDHNSIHDIGVIFNDAVGILVGGSFQNRISHNEIYNGHWCGIALGWENGYVATPSRDNLVEFNHVHHLGQPDWISDLGGIYLAGMSPGTRVTNNLIHDIGGRYTAMGIYADEGASYITFDNNIVYATLSAAFMQNYGRENVFKNNIFYSQTDAQVWLNRAETTRSLRFTNNIVAYRTGTLHRGPWTKSVVDVDSNLYFQFGGVPKFGESQVSLSQWQQLGRDLNSVTADPCFADAAAGNFKLCDGSPAGLIGFVPIDMSGVGPQPPFSASSNSAPTAVLLKVDTKQGNLSGE